MPINVPISHFFTRFLVPIPSLTLSSQFLLCKKVHSYTNLLSRSPRNFCSNFISHNFITKLSLLYIKKLLIVLDFLLSLLKLFCSGIHLGRYIDSSCCLPLPPLPSLLLISFVGLGVFFWFFLPLWMLGFMACDKVVTFFCFFGFSRVCSSSADFVQGCGF